jgi:phage gp36-like protein
MAYSSDSDLLKEMSTLELAVLTGDTTGTTVNTTRTSNARENADALINSYLHQRYTVPFASPVDAIIKKLSVDLTIANLYESAYSKTVVPSTVLYRRQNAIKLLQDIQEGNVSVMSLASGSITPTPIFSNKSNVERTFPDSVLDAFMD